jgi:tRNA dimethylallyltransferase
MYKGFPIITNKVTKEECDGVKHHLLDFINISEEYNVKDFVPLALEKVCYIVL